MKKYFAKTFMSLCALGISSVAFAQEATETAVEGGMYQALKTKFIEGGADFMSLVAIALIFGLAFCLERIIYLNLAETNSSKLLKGIEDALDKGDVEGAKAIARDTRGPIASIAYQGLMRIDQGIDVVEKIYCFLWWCSGWTFGKEHVLDHIVYRNGSVIRILGNCSRYDHGVR